MNPPTSTPWYRQLNGYHWFVLIVAALGWLFDCLDQQLFVLARPAAMRELVTEDSVANPELLDSARRLAGDVATSIFIAGWATGGLFFGMLGDKWGRAKTMIITILMYSLFTGLSSLSSGPWDFALYRFLTGLGVGGEFAVGVALVAEVMPSAARPYALSLLQALSAIGNVSAALINLGFGLAQEQGLVNSPWRWMFLIGAAPALLALIVRWNLKEPQQWQRAKENETESKQLGSYRELFGTPLWRKHALLGLALGCSGIIGLWTVGFYTPDLIRSAQRPAVTTTIYLERLGEARASSQNQLADDLQTLLDLQSNPDPSSVVVPPSVEALRKELDGAINGRLNRWQSYTSMAINVGAFLGMFGFGALAQRIGRKRTFAIAFVAAYVTTISVFWFLKEFWQIWLMVPVMGFCQLSLFAGYAIYFPELFPTRLRSTGTSFCYNVGRFVAALGPLIKSQLDKLFQSTFSVGGTEALRYSGVAMATVFLIGLCVLPFLPETKDAPLPD